jgi:hypothetical protein
MQSYIPIRIPFEHVKDQKDLKTFIAYILNEIKVEEVRAFMPKDFDTKLIYDPKAILDVVRIEIGKVSFENIRMDSMIIMDAFRAHVNKVKANDALGEHDKFEIYSEVHAWMYNEYGFFNSMNPFRYMSSFSWKIIFNEGEEDYMISKLSLTNEQWNYLENSMIIRRQLLDEFLYWVNGEMDDIRSRFAKPTKYSWRGNQKEYELHELILALIAGNRINIEKGDEKTFVNEFLALFGESDKDYPYYRDKILSRAKRATFLKSLAESLDTYKRKDRTHSSD